MLGSRWVEVVARAADTADYMRKTIGPTNNGDGTPVSARAASRSSRAAFIGSATMLLLPTVAYGATSGDANPPASPELTAHDASASAHPELGARLDAVEGGGPFSLLKLAAPVADKAGFRWSSQRVDFGRPHDDPIAILGYNFTGAGGAKEVAGLPGMGFVMEGDYQKPDATRQMEMYPELWSADGRQSWRPFQIYASATENTPAGFPLSFSLDGPVGGITLAARDAAGESKVVANFQATQSSILGIPGQHTIFNVTAPTGFTAIFTMQQGGFDALRITHNLATQGEFQIGNGTGLQSNRLFRWYSVPGATAGAAHNTAHACFGGDNVNSAVLTVSAPAAHAAYSVLNLKKSSSSMSADVLGLLDQEAAVLSRFNKAGRFSTQVATAPALADVADGELSLSVGASGDLIVTSRIAGVLKTGTLTVA